MAHVDPTRSVDTLELEVYEHIDEEAEADDAWMLIFHEGKMKRMSIFRLAEVFDHLINGAGGPGPGPGPGPG